MKHDLSLTHEKRASLSPVPNAAVSLRAQLSVGTPTLGTMRPTAFFGRKDRMYLRITSKPSMSRISKCTRHRLDATMRRSCLSMGQAPFMAIKQVG